MKPQISIIIPMYNAERYIIQTLDSINEQERPNIEVLLIDDGSVDATYRICEDYINSNKNGITYSLLHQENHGVSDARNKGMMASEGDYLMFLDADDLLPANAIRDYLDIIQENSYDAIIGNHAYVYDKPYRIIHRNSRLSCGEYCFDDVKDRVLDDGTLTGILFGSVCGVLYRTEVIKSKNIRFIEDVTVNEDGLFNIVFLSKADKVLIIPNITYHYRQWKNTKTNKLSVDKRFIDSAEQFNYHVIRILGDSGQLQMYRRHVSVGFWNALRIQNTRASYIEARKYLIKIFSDSMFEKGFRYMDYKNMSGFKCIVCYLMKSKFYFMFYILIKYISPVLERILPR